MASMARKAAAFAVVAAALVVLFFVAVNTGSLQVSPDQLLAGLFVAYDEDVAAVFDLRFPRVFIAMAGGAALAVAGVLLQAAIRNPLADPGIIGITAGSSFFAAAAVALLPMLTVLAPLFAFAGGLVAFAIVYGLSWRDGLSPLRIILTGVAVSALFTGLSSAFNTGTGGDMTGVASIVNANITLKTWDDLLTLAAYAVPALVVAFVLAKRCDLLALEDKTVRSLGADVDANRLAVSAVAVLLASISTAIIGPVSFLGLVVPHIARIIVGSAHRVLIPFSVMLGAFCLLLADTVGRTIVAPYEISAAVVMSVVGGPAFILLLRKARGSYAER